jgi:hypothetical protein
MNTAVVITAKINSRKIDIWGIGVQRIRFDGKSGIVRQVASG